MHPTPHQGPLSTVMLELGASSRAKGERWWATLAQGTEWAVLVQGLGPGNSPTGTPWRGLSWPALHPLG